MFKLKNPIDRLEGMGGLGFEPVTIAAGLTAASSILPSIVGLFTEPQKQEAQQQLLAQQTAAQQQQAENAIALAVAQARAAQAAAQQQQTTLQLQAALAEQQAASSTKRYVGYAILAAAGVAALIGVGMFGKALLRRAEP